jgi:hypothetical protein
MRPIDADVLKFEYRNRLTNSLINRDRDIDLSKYAEEPCRIFNEFVDTIPTISELEINNDCCTKR